MNTYQLHDQQTNPAGSHINRALVFQRVSIPGRSYTILVPIPEQVIEFDERFDLTIITENVIAEQLSGYAFGQESAKRRFTKRTRLSETAPGGKSIEIVVQGTIGHNRDGELVLLALHRIIVEAPVDSELEVENDIESGHYPFRCRTADNGWLVQGSPLLLTKGAFDLFWDEIDELQACGFREPPAFAPEESYTFAQAIKQPWCCRYRSPGRFLKFLREQHYSNLETGRITEIDFNRLLAKRRARRARYKANWQETDRANKKRHARKPSLGADSHEKSAAVNTVKEKVSCPQK